MKVKLKKLNEDAHLPEKAYNGDFCYDVYAVSEEEVAPNVWKYKLGFAYEIERPKDFWANWGGLKVNVADFLDNFNISIDARPRSSIWKTGMVLSNSCGTLDEFYRNEAMAVFYHVMPNMPRYKVGDKICQIKLGLTIPMEFEWADEINTNTERGLSGFGSSDKK